MDRSNCNSAEKTRMSNELPPRRRRVLLREREERGNKGGSMGGQEERGEDGPRAYEGRGCSCAVGGGEEGAVEKGVVAMPTPWSEEVEDEGGIPGRCKVSLQVSSQSISNQFPVGDPLLSWSWLVASKSSGTLPNPCLASTRHLLPLNPLWLLLGS